MYSINYSKRFEKDLKRCRKRGLNIQLIKDAVTLLAATGTLPMKYRPHKLLSQKQETWECHIVANVFLVLMPVISEDCAPCLPSSLARILLRLLPVSSESSCPSSLGSDACHHFALTLVITPLSRSCLLGRCFPREGRRGLTPLFEDSPKSLHTIAGRQYNKKPLRILFLSG